MTSLLDMNDVAMRKILEKLDIKTILILRNTCRTLRNFIDDCNLKPNLNELLVFVPAKNRRTNFSLKIDNITKNLEYKLVGKASEAMTSILNFQRPKTIQKFSFKFEQNVFDEVHFELLDVVEKLLKSRPLPLPDENFTLRISKSRQILQILPYLDSNFLKTIEITPSFEHHTWKPREKLEDIEEIMELEQFKKATDIAISGFIVEKSATNFVHFEKISMTLDGVPWEDLMVLKEAFIQSSHMKRYEMEGHLWDKKQLEIAFECKFPKSGYQRESIYFLCENGEFLIIELHQIINLKLNFYRMPLEKLPGNSIF